MQRVRLVRELGIHVRVRLLIGIAAAGLLLFAVMAFVTISEVRTGSSAFQQNRVAYDISRDFVDASQSLLSAYPFYRMSLAAHTEAEIAKVRAYLSASRAQLEVGHQHYLHVALPDQLRDLVTVQSYQSAEQWHTSAEREYMPLIERGELEQAETVRTVKMEPLFERNREINAEIGRLNDAWIAANASDVERTVWRRSWQLGGMGLLLLLTQFLLGVMIDRRAEESARRLQSTLEELRRKNKEVEEFVYIVSHDLRAPLVNVQGFVYELEDSCARLRAVISSCTQAGERCQGALHAILDDEIVGALHYISASTTKFERLISALLGLSRQGRQVYQIRQLDMRQVVTDTLASLRQLITEAGAEIQVDALPTAFADATAAGQVFSNLIGNALKYRDPLRKLQIEVGGQKDVVGVRYWVKDNGLGIPEAGKSRLFQVFQRLHPQCAQGDGIGLAFVHRIVERHGGKTWAESQEGSGSTFYFSLPLASDTAPYEAEESSEYESE